jgi:hypothetical protein
MRFITGSVRAMKKPIRMRVSIWDSQSRARARRSSDLSNCLPTAFDLRVALDAHGEMELLHDLRGSLSIFQLAATSILEWGSNSGVKLGENFVSFHRTQKAGPGDRPEKRKSSS